MKLFWRVNLWINLSVFVLFIVFLVGTTVDVVPDIMYMIGPFFLYGPYLEIVQVPICILALFITPKPRRWYLYLLLMIISFAIKNLLVFIILAMAAETHYRQG